MKRNFLIILIILLLPLVVLPLLPTREQYVWGRIRIPVRGITAEVCTTEQAPACGCCHALYGGGKVTVSADLSQVQVGDIAYLTSLDGDKIVVECVGIVYAVVGFIRADGDVILYTDANRWQFVRVLRLVIL